MSRPESQTNATTEEADPPDRPDGIFDYTVIGVSTAIVAVTFYLAVRYLLWPGEQAETHIKRTVLEEEP